MIKKTFSIGGMNCSACSSGIERALGRKRGVKKIEVNLVQSLATIEFDEKEIALEEIFAFIDKLGYRVDFDKKIKKESYFDYLENQVLTLNIRVFLAFIFSIFVVYIGMLGMLYPNILPDFLRDLKINSSLQCFFTLIVMHLGRNFYFKGFKALLNKMPNMDTLIAIGSGSSFLYSFVVYLNLFFDYKFLAKQELYFESTCLILTFVLLGKMIEKYSKEKVLKSLDIALDFYKQKALKLQNGEYKEVEIRELVEGDFVRVLPGDFVPVDGVITKGMTSFDESMLSGESLPIVKKVGENIFGGSINLEQMVEMRVEKIYTQSTISQILNLVKEAQSTKAPIARIADKISGFFVPLVIAIALLSSLFWWLNHKDFSFALEIFVSVLVVSCPCALGLATPMAILVGSIRGMQNSILFKNAEILENAHKIDCIIFDKTGTLTEGNFEVIKIQSLSSLSKEYILGLMASIEMGSNHPIAKAILGFAKKEKISLRVASDYQNIVGRGIKATIDSRQYEITQYPLKKQDELSKKIAVCLYEIVQDKKQELGIIYLQDKIKEEAKECIDALKKLKKEIFILSGDDKGAVEDVAQKLGISKFFSNLKPEDKLEFVKNLKNQGYKVMMVGDGLNDAPALSLSDISLSMGGGSDLSKDKSDIVLLNNDILNVVNSIKLSKAVIKNIKENLFFAFFYNIIAIVFACGIGYKFNLTLNPMIAAFAMSCSSICVVLNAQRLYFFRFFKIKGVKNGIRV
ncbi:MULTISPECIES: heavy metal translocating P-type ATPase [unclassified Helicobacter]|uniref:heavy metal translocating P-type ATPase n=1 Tax=unclassified Helicobacter TaxID=2593540 RepID=UPI000CF0BE89|nr:MULTISPECIES: heavy metal translocating P-type ATPase [unclassified Helicobacter]